MAAKNKFPRDRFDSLKQGGVRGARVGAHRAEPKPRFFWRWALATLLMTLVLSLAGIMWLMRVGAESTVFSSAKELAAGSTSSQETTTKNTESADSANSAPAESADSATSGSAAAAQETQPAAAEIDPEATVAVLNGSGVAGVAAKFAQQIRADGLGQVASVGNAASSQAATSTVYYADQAYAGAAEALARELGGLQAVQDSSFAVYGTNLAVVIGADLAR